MNLKRFISSVLVLLALVGVFMIPTGASSYDTAKSLYDGIASYKMTSCGVSDEQSWISTRLASDAGVSSEWYILTLSQMGNYDFSAYKSALLSYISANNVSSAVARQKYALALIASSSGDKFIYSTLNDSIGKMGIMSWIYGLHLVNNGYTASYSAGSIVSTLISMQKSDGGWAVTGNYGDVDVTAMCIQSLAPYYSQQNVKSAVDKALGFLSSRQDENGNFASYGTVNSESVSQVIVALSSLGIDSATDRRFIKNGKNPIDVLYSFKTANGAVSHTLGGAANENATVQAFYAAASYLRYNSGLSPLYILDRRNPSALAVPETTKVPTATVQTEKPTATTARPSASTTQEAVNTVGEVTAAKTDTTVKSGSDSSGADTTKKEKDETTKKDKSDPETTETRKEETVKTTTVTAETTGKTVKDEVPKKHTNLNAVIPVAVILLLIISAGVVTLIVLKKKKK